MKRSLLLISAWMLCLQALAGPAANVAGWYAPHGNGKFSAAARDVCKGMRAASNAEIWSPNHAWKVVTRPSMDGATRLFAIDQVRHAFPIEAASWSCPEISWSPASALFFVTYSDGGAVGTYHVAAYRISSGRMKKLDLTGAARRDFQKRYPKCFSPEAPNIAGIAWSADSRQLLVAAQVLPHANCDDMGTFNIERIPQPAARALLHGVIGPALRAADDACLSTVGSCWIPGLHQTRKNG
jgi:hypothetical protein